MVLEQLKTAFEQEGMTPDEIAEDMQLDLTAVKAGLMQCSAKYRGMCRSEPEEKARFNFSDEQREYAKQVICDLMMGAEDEHLRAKMAVYVRDDSEGRKEVVRNMGNQTFNILQFNEQLGAARDKMRNITQQVLNTKGVTNGG